jgi:hypothetical protein
MSTPRLPVALSLAALVVVLLDATPLGHAAERAITTTPPFAKKTGYANLAADSQRLAGHRASVTGGAGTVPRAR